MSDGAYTPEIQTVLNVWRPYVHAITDWQARVKDITPKATGCGPVYELGNPLGRPNESLAIADMRSITHAQPHYHTGGETEIYIVIAGSGRAVVGSVVSKLQKGTVLVTPPDITHYALPDPVEGLVLAVINTPPFKLENNVDVFQTDPAHHYNHEQFLALTQR